MRTSRRNQTETDVAARAAAKAAAEAGRKGEVVNLTREQFKNTVGGTISTMLQFGSAGRFTTLKGKVPAGLCVPENEIPVRDLIHTHSSGIYNNWQTRVQAWIADTGHVYVKETTSHNADTPDPTWTTHWSTTPVPKHFSICDIFGYDATYGGKFSGLWAFLKDQSPTVSYHVTDGMDSAD